MKQLEYKQAMHEITIAKFGFKFNPKNWWTRKAVNLGKTVAYFKFPARSPTAMCCPSGLNRIDRMPRELSATALASPM